MTTGTKVFLAVFAAFIGVLVLYYGVLMPEAQSLPDIGTATREVTQLSTDAATPTTEILAAVDPIMTNTGAGTSGGVLTETVQGAMMGPQPSPEVVPLTTPPPVQPQTQPTAPGHVASSVPSTPIANQPVSISGGVVSTPNPTSSSQSPTSLPPNTSEYIVKSDDTMSSIAQSWFGDASKWSIIAKENPLVDPNRLTIGQKLRLPSKDAKPVSVKEQAAGDQPMYTVRSGDTLSKIAREYYGDVAKWKAIYDANKLAIGSDPAVLKAGIKLKLPPPSKPASR